MSKFLADLKTRKERQDEGPLHYQHQIQIYPDRPEQFL